MEIFVDFGLFELLIAVGLASLSRKIFSGRLSGVLFLVFSALAPVALLLVARTELLRWLAVVCLVPALINVTALAVIMRRHSLAELLARQTSPHASA